MRGKKTSATQNSKKYGNIVAPHKKKTQFRDLVRMGK
jgi:hypothetical protein